MLSPEVNARDLVLRGRVAHVTALRAMAEHSSQERTRQNLQASVAHLMASNTVGVVVASDSGDILEANAYWLNLLGRSRAEFDAGRLNWRSLTAPASMPVSLHMLETLVLTGDCPPHEKSYVHADGSLVHMLVGLARLPLERDRILAIAVDISEQKAAQDRLTALNTELQERSLQAERAEAAKTQFLSTVSHELRTPLHTALGYVRLLQRKQTEGSEEQQQLGIVERSASHLLRLIDDLLEFNHTAVAPVRLHADWVDMRGFLLSLEGLFAPLAEHSGNRFELQLDAALPAAILVDEGRLVQILRILVENACKYSRNGVIRVGVQCQCPTRPFCAAPCQLLFSVEDTGRGITQADVGRIFEPMHRGSNATDRPGLGLGLAIANQWIQRMGSEIVVQSQLGVGSRFSFALGVKADLAPGERLPPSVPMPPPHKPLPAVEPLPPLPDAELAMLGQLIGMGRVGRLGAWARDLGSNYPALLPISQRLASLAANAEVGALEQLYQRWLALASEPF